MKLAKRSSLPAGLISCLVVVFVGCGGGGGGDDDDGGPAPAPVPPVESRAPTSIAGQTLTLSGISPRELTFGSTGNVWSEVTDAGVTGGTYQYTVAGSTADLLLSGAEREVTLRLAFASAGTGTYTLLSDNPEQGTFTLALAEEPPNPDDPGAGDGYAPSSLDGLTLYGTRTFTTTGPVGQTHIYTFTGNTFHDSDPPEESDGSYSYQLNGNRATLSLNYYAPEEFNGDRHDLNMMYHTEKSGSFESVYTRRDGTTIRINGTFQVQ